MDNVLYLDHAATTKIDEEVFREMLPYFRDAYGNASSLYSLGKKSKIAIENARKQVANAINCKDNEIYFTSCGSESDNLAIKGIAKSNARYGKHIITSSIEHPAVLETCKSLEKDGFSISYIPVSENGIIDIESLKKLIRRDTILISVMTANNEIGTIQPLEKIGRIARKNNIIFHTDAVQAIGNIKVDVKKLNIDSLSMSGHKFYGPKGIGALYVRNGVNFIRQQDGGHQEKEKRSGTENVAGIVGLGKAIELANNNLFEINSKLSNLRNIYIKSVLRLFKNVHVNGDITNRLPGSACSAGLPMPSPVLMNMYHNVKIAESSLRVTFGKENRIEDVERVVKALYDIIELKK